MLISPSGTALISELDEARLADATQSCLMPPPETGGAAFRHMAPELLEDEPEATMGVDVWAFGMLIMVCLSTADVQKNIGCVG